MSHTCTRGCFVSAEGDERKLTVRYCKHAIKMPPPSALKSWKALNAFVLADAYRRHGEPSPRYVPPKTNADIAKEEISKVMQAIYNHRLAVPRSIVAACPVCGFDARSVYGDREWNEYVGWSWVWCRNCKRLYPR